MLARREARVESREQPRVVFIPQYDALLCAGRLVVYDFGCVRTFDRDAARALAGLAAAARADDTQRMRVCIMALGGRPPDDADTTEILRRFVQGVFAPIIEPGPHAVAPEVGLHAKSVIRDKRALHRLALPPRMLFLFRLRFGLYVVLARLGSIVDWGALEEQLAVEAEVRLELGGSSPSTRSRQEPT